MLLFQPPTITTMKRVLNSLQTATSLIIYQQFPFSDLHPQLAVLPSRCTAQVCPLLPPSCGSCVVQAHLPCLLLCRPLQPLGPQAQPRGPLCLNPVLSHECLRLSIRALYPLPAQALSSLPRPTQVSPLPWSPGPSPPPLPTPNPGLTESTSSGFLFLNSHLQLCFLTVWESSPSAQPGPPGHPTAGSWPIANIARTHPKCPCVSAAPSVLLSCTLRAPLLQGCPPRLSVSHIQTTHPLRPPLPSRKPVWERLGHTAPRARELVPSSLKPTNRVSLTGRTFTLPALGLHPKFLNYS